MNKFISLCLMLLPLSLTAATGHPDITQYSHLIDDKELHIQKSIFSILACDYRPSQYEQLWLTTLRNKHTSPEMFKIAAKRISHCVMQKSINAMRSEQISIETSLSWTKGVQLTQDIHLVSIMRGGDVLLEEFIYSFPNAKISKFIIERNEETTLPEFKYKKLAPKINDGSLVVICEPMVATGSALRLVIECLLEKGVDLHNIMIASIITCPEAMDFLSWRYPTIKFITCAIDDKINDVKFIVPGMGDFADRYYGTE